MLYEEAQEQPQPLDRFLARYFHINRKRVGARDRRRIQDAIFGMHRYRLLVETWCRELEVSQTILPAACAMVCENRMTAQDFKDICAEIEPPVAEDTSQALYDHLRARDLPEPLKGSELTARLSTRYSMPEWLVKSWLDEMGENAAVDLLDSLLERAPFVVRANPLKITREKLAIRLISQGYSVEQTQNSPWGLKIHKKFNVQEVPEFRLGLFEIQDEGSQMICMEVDPRPGETCWDACTGGGGKALLLGAVMDNKGILLASDIRHNKLEELKKRAHRAGLKNLVVGQPENISRNPAALNGVDRILVDAPCSGTGTFRRMPDAKWRINEHKIEGFQAQQLTILNFYQRFLKPGGKLIYSTCSLQSRENEDVIEKFLKEHQDFEIFGAPKKFLPNKLGTDGFFVAKLIKT